MLRRLDLKGSWRSLNKDFWPDDLPLGKRTVIYGHNGSGKSTLSELLLAVSEGKATADVIWEDESRRRTTVSAGAVGPSPCMAVFTRKWVDANLSAFLDGESVSAIVTLGQEAIHAKEEEANLEREIAQLQQAASEAAQHRVAADQKLDQMARGVQDEIIAQLQVFDYKHFTRNRYSLPKVKELLSSYEGEFPDATAHAEALEGLGEQELASLSEVVTPPANIAERISGLIGLLSQTPTRLALAELENAPTIQGWVEKGMPLHAGLDSCLFCAGALTEERRQKLAQHFDESWLQIRGRTQTLLAAVSQEKTTLGTWAESLPDPTLLVRDLQAVYREAAERIASAVTRRIAILEGIEEVLQAKIDDPSCTPEAPDLTPLAESISTTALSKAVAKHNDHVRRHEEVISGHKRTVLDHLIGRQSKAFCDLAGEATDAYEKSTESVKAAELAEHKLDELRQQQFSTSAMADTLTSDLARVYGKNHLSISVTDDGKSYFCRRGDDAATDLSEGERTTLSLLYFLRKLEDEQEAGIDPTQRIVVIDDPSSSLDREALFATHQWLLDTLSSFGQFVVLTHDFGLLRLFLKSQKNGWGKSLKQIRERNTSEETYPKVAFLEMFALTAEGKRGSKVGKLPRLLLNNTSEYAYLFSMVMAGVADSDDHERLFLLPNAARRVLEVFSSYKAPHLPNFEQQLKSLIETADGAPYRDVYDFCNRYSHGEGNESVDVLDARAVHGQIRRCMEFLKSVDPEHFERMCRAADADANSLG
ncbi:AAA family ATPase [Rhodococcus pyridinivorans]|uniref:AAA family ATPase n=1 Tax=Rhodococcus pyridinivorans TaxID=103816 RepID=UPI00110D9B33|nr:AAA family ATPase [Rhodococcus pyridinivorans]